MVVALRLLVVSFLALAAVGAALAGPVQTLAGPGRLEVRAESETCLRVTLTPLGTPHEVPDNPLVVPRKDAPLVLSVESMDQPVRKQVGPLVIDVTPSPLTVSLSRADGQRVQQVVFQPDGGLSFPLDASPVFGLGAGGPHPPRGARTADLSVEFDRRGRLHQMRPRWQGGIYGSRNPVSLIIGARGWALYVASPWGEVDLRDAKQGYYRPSSVTAAQRAQQDFHDQTRQLGKGLPPIEAYRPGAYDIYMLDADDPQDTMRDIARIAGRAVMPPRWALGYMQSHRTLRDDAQMVEIVETFRQKQIPLDAVIYLGTGFTPRGWNTPQPSFEFNPEVFHRPPEQVIQDLHALHVKVALHMVPWARDKLPTLRGSIPPNGGEAPGDGHIADYWRQHNALVAAGVDGWWPDEGDWLNLYERVKRHQLYYQGPLSTQPNLRPWSLHRNGHLGVARWGGWIWSGDTHSSWKALEAQIAVGVNASLSLSPYWGSDIGGFFPTRELTGELYARWFQFGAFCPSFRSHGRTWWTRLPWGWGLDQLGPLESGTPPHERELNNPAIEPIAKRYGELRYQLLSYNYTLAWQARQHGLPLMRAMWLHYPDDAAAVGLGDQYLWGRDLLVAPVYRQGATTRSVYLPAGEWYDWWTGERQRGGRTVTRSVDLATMPLYVRAGALLPLDPVRQYTAEEVDAPLKIRIYRGADGQFTLYEDDGHSLAYLEGRAVLTHFAWDDQKRRLSVTRDTHQGEPAARPIQVELLPDRAVKQVRLEQSLELQF